MLSALCNRRIEALHVLPAFIPLLCAVNTEAQIQFEDVTSGSGITFTLQNSPTPEKRMIETMAGGLAVFDYNGDSLPDIFFTNGADAENLRKSSPEYFNRLYRNEGDMHFTDVTRQAGVHGAGYSMGATAADFDNDGDLDLFVAGVFRNLLYRNQGDGTFEDISELAGISKGEWSVAAGWFDYDNDSLLDLFVVNYADWTLDFNRFCGDRDRGMRVYCHPKYLKPTANRLYRNLGSGRFEDHSKSAGLLSHKGRGMSASFADFDGNGYQDVFVTNDNLPNFMFFNQDGKTFSEDALLSGVALLDHGRPVASMGVDVGDYNNDRVLDIFVTALSNETFPLFRGEPGGTFRDATVPSGLAKSSRQYAGWGNVFADLDNDGWLDLVTANSHVNDLVENFEPFIYKQSMTVFQNQGTGIFAQAQEFGQKAVYRAVSTADFDADGRLDVIATALSGPATIWRNVTAPSGHWIALELVGSASNRDAIGSRIEISSQTRLKKTSVGYASSNLGAVHFGLGDSDDTVQVEIEWTSGNHQVVQEVPVNQRFIIRQAK